MRIRSPAARWIIVDVYPNLPNKLVTAANGIDYAYRDTGPGAGSDVPLVLFQHHTEFAADVEAFLR